MKHILLAEDDPFIVDIYANFLRKQGYGLEIAKDCEMALEKIKGHLPDLLLLDVSFGEGRMNGWDLLGVIRENPTTKNLKVIVVSNVNEADCQDNIAKFQVAKFLFKVVTTPEEILKAVKEIIG